MRISEEHIAQLRANAQIERTATLEARGRQGEDPLITLTDMPSIDELVVIEIRDEILESRNLLAEFTLASLAAKGSDSEAAIHRKNVEAIEFALIREIAEENPELTVGAWARLAKLTTIEAPVSEH